MKKLLKGLLFTDIHWGKKQNSDNHNHNCLDFIHFIIYHIKQDVTIDHIIFLGDWFDNRNTVNVSTLNYAHLGAKLLNDLNLPVFFIIGNHDLYTRVHRKVYSTIMYHNLTNFHVINEPTIINYIGDGALLCPFLFHSEYNILNNYKHLPNYYGHFEFEGFVITGYNITMQNGPDHTLFSEPKHIFSGHFHKRQAHDNVIYIGNTFPMDYSDANDNNRGFAIHDHNTDDITFTDWPACPKYINTKLSAILDGSIVLTQGANVKCYADIEITYEESIKLRKLYSKKHKLQEFTIEEHKNNDYSDIGTIATESLLDDGKPYNIDDTIVMMLREIDTPQIDNKLLIEIYQSAEVINASIS
jgi:DNA repair exonuclease SbcCD nuclease subunit